MTDVQARTRSDLATVALVAPAGSRAASELPLDLLAELGKRDDVAGRSSHSQDDAALVVLWLNAHRTGWVVVTSPHALDTPTLQYLATVCLPAGTGLLLACDNGTSRGVLADLADYGAAALPWEAVGGLVEPPDGPLPAEDPEPGADWDERDLTLPREDWPTFRSECRRLLHPDTFRQVDALYVTAFRAARAWLRDNTPTETATAQAVGRVIGRTGSADAAVVALRACQAAHMEAGWMLRVDLDQVLPALSDRPAVLTDAQWRSLRAYRDPYRSAAVTLHQHGMTAGDMHRCPVGLVARDGRAVDGRDLDLRGAPYVRAYLSQRLANGATDDDPLFPDLPRRTVNALRDARTDLGLRLGTGKLSAGEHPADRWQRRLGLTLWDLR